MRKLLLLVLLTILCSSLVYSANVLFTAEISPEEHAIKANETATFNLKIIHEGAAPETFELFSQDIVWDIQTEKALSIPPGKDGSSVEFTMRPLYVSPGYYGIPLTVRQAGTSNAVKKVVRLRLQDPYGDKAGYIPAVKGSLKLNKQINPSEEVVISLQLENQNMRDLSKLDVKLRSKLLNKDVVTTLAPLERKELAFNLVLDPKTPPQKDLMKISLFAYEGARSYQFDIPLEEYEIVAYGRVDKKLSEEKSFLKSTVKISLENIGNIARKEFVAEKKSFFPSLFTKVSPDAKREKGEYKWEVLLNVGETQTITLTTNYWPLFIFGVVALCALVAYLLLRSPIVLKKKAKIVNTKEGGISELKIILSVKNRSGKHVNNVRIIDMVPKLAEYVKHTELGTLQPYKDPTPTMQGSLLHWKIDSIDPRGDVLITYRIKNKLSVLEGLTLPIAVAKFEIASHLERSTKSNVVEIVF
jgi:hypothetical protein